MSNHFAVPMPKIRQIPKGWKTSPPGAEKSTSPLTLNRKNVTFISIYSGKPSTLPAFRLPRIFGTAKEPPNHRPAAQRTFRCPHLPRDCKLPRKIGRGLPDMKKPEMEIVKFHNEDVIATSGRWSEKVYMYPDKTIAPWSTPIPIVRNLPSESKEVWMNSEAWNTRDPSGMYNTPIASQVYGDTNTLDGKPIGSSSYESIFSESGGGVYMHYDQNSHIGPWDNVYTVWETCGGTGCSHCYN